VSCLIIAEAGVNHNGNLLIAKQLVRAAKDAGADCIKFQTFKAETLVTQHAVKASYQKKQGQVQENQFTMLKQLELSYDEFINISDYCKEQGIMFLSTPFDMESIAFLNTLDMPFWKIPSGEITNYPYLVSIAQTHKPIVLSTGMSTLDEVRDALNILKTHGATAITLLHCTTEYPAPYDEVNLTAMLTLQHEFHLPTGYSDHTRGIEIPLAAVALGAAIVEKHFTLDRNMKGPDHIASIEPGELKEMIRAIRNIEIAMGDGQKKPSASEIPNIAIVRKSIVAKLDIREGTVFTSDNVTVKRPGNGLSPMQWNEIIGKTAKRNYEKDECIEL
jgi:N,N'-diacetyllegionaminate synthase